MKLKNNRELNNIAIKFMRLYNGEDNDSNEFIFIHGIGQPDDPIGYNFFSTFFPDLIILLIYLRKYFPKSIFFKTSGFKKELSEYGKLIKKNERLGNEIKIVGLKLKEQQKNNDLKKQSDFNKPIKNTKYLRKLSSSKWIELEEKRQLLQLENEVLAERMQVIALDINTQMLANYPFLKSKHIIHGNNGFFPAWNYSNSCIGLVDSISKKFKTPNEYIINLIK